MNWDQIGSYCGRIVAIAQLDPFSTRRIACDLSDSTLLVVLKMDVALQLNIDGLLRGLASGNPLSIALFGTGAGAAFDTLLRVLSQFPSQGHIMSQLCHGETLQAGLDDFLCSSWPSQERHDNWRMHRVLIVGDESVYVDYLSQVKAMFAD